MSISSGISTGKYNNFIEMNQNNRTTIEAMQLEPNYNMLEEILQNSNNLIKIFEVTLKKDLNKLGNGLLNNIKTAQQKRLVLQFIKTDQMQQKIKNKLQTDKIVKMYQQCLKQDKLPFLTMQQKQQSYMQLLQGKIQNDVDSLTVLKEYVQLWQKVRKCFIMKIDHEDLPKKGECGLNMLNLDKLQQTFKSFKCNCNKWFYSNSGLGSHANTCPSINSNVTKIHKNKNELQIQMQTQHISQKTRSKNPKTKIIYKYDK